jgi:hypothetical protein
MAESYYDEDSSHVRRPGLLYAGCFRCGAAVEGTLDHAPHGSVARTRGAPLPPFAAACGKAGPLRGSRQRRQSLHPVCEWTSRWRWTGPWRPEPLAIRDLRSCSLSFWRRQPGNRHGLELRHLRADCADHRPHCLSIAGRWSQRSCTEHAERLDGSNRAGANRHAAHARRRRRIHGERPRRKA